MPNGAHRSSVPVCPLKIPFSWTVMSLMKVPISPTSAVALLKTLLPLLLLVVLTDGQAMFNGTCPERQAMEDFELKPLMGKWYENSAYPDADSIVRCATYTFSSDGDDRFRVLGDAVLVSSSERFTKPADFQFENSQSVAEFKVTYTNSTSNHQLRVKILYTDYNSTCFIWSCTDEMIDNRKVNVQVLFILTRDSFPGTALENRNVKMAQKLGLNMERLVKTDQQNCTAPTGTGED